MKFYMGKFLLIRFFCSHVYIVCSTLTRINTKYTIIEIDLEKEQYCIITIIIKKRSKKTDKNVSIKHCNTILFPVIFQKTIFRSDSSHNIKLSIRIRQFYNN
uniref:Uncharacterized protein n=1 Tax=Cacopsylla melanoneura TaxID=428564 RepID=A0A8D8VZ41_9HEMI